MLKDVGLENFNQEVLSVVGPVLVDFWSPQCSPCRAIMPTLESINGAHAKVVKVNIHDEPELAEHFKVTALPTVVAFRLGKEVGRSQGLKSRDSLLALVRERPAVLSA